MATAVTFHCAKCDAAYCRDCWRVWGGANEVAEGASGLADVRSATSNRSALEFHPAARGPRDGQGGRRPGNGRRDRAKRLVVDHGAPAISSAGLLDCHDTAPTPPFQRGSVAPGRLGSKWSEYRTLGRTGVKVSPLCLGAMMFGEWGNPDHEASIRIIHRALDAGLNFVDTADVYSGGESEEIVAKALKGRRDQVVLATKVHFPMGEGPNEGGNSRRWIIQECEASLRRLGTDWIDLYQIHRWDPETDHDETLGALTDLVRAGKVRYVGSSTYPAERDRGGAAGCASARPRALRLRAAAVLDARARDRGGGAARLREARDGRYLLGPARRRLADRRLAQGEGAACEHACRAAAAALRPRRCRRTSGSWRPRTPWHSWPRRPACR